MMGLSDTVLVAIVGTLGLIIATALTAGFGYLVSRPMKRGIEKVHDDVAKVQGEVDKVQDEVKTVKGTVANVHGQVEEVHVLATATEHAVNDQDRGLPTLIQRVTEQTNDTDWVADSLVAISKKVGVKLPERPIKPPGESPGKGRKVQE